MKHKYSQNTCSTFSSFQNRKLLKDIEKGKVSIKNVLLSAVKRGMISETEYKTMTFRDFWAWLVMNKIKYGKYY